VKQLAVIPPEYEHQQYCDDSPAEAQLDAHRVQPDDLLLLASDGLWSGRAEADGGAGDGGWGNRLAVAVDASPSNSLPAASAFCCRPLPLLPAGTI